MSEAGKTDDIPEAVQRMAESEAIKYLDWLRPAMANTDSDATHVLAGSFARLILAERERFRPILTDLYVEEVWIAYGAGIERDGKWMDAALSDAEQLRRDLGLPDGWHDALAVQAMLPDLVRSKVEAALSGEPSHD